MTPPADVDLSLYVLTPGCPSGSFTTNCIVGDDSGAQGTAEIVSFPAVAGTAYYVVVDGFSNGAAPVKVRVTGLLSPLDIDGDGEIEPLTDGLLMLRYHFGFTGATLINHAVDLVHCTRCSAGQIEGYLGMIEESL